MLTASSSSRVRCQLSIVEYHRALLRHQIAAWTFRQIATSGPDLMLPTFSVEMHVERCHGYV
jgi:hypothetical protein